MGHSRPLFLYFRLFYKQLTVNKCSIKVANDWIRTRVLWYRKRQLCIATTDDVISVICFFSLQNLAWIIGQNFDQSSVSPFFSLLQAIVIANIYFSLKSIFMGIFLQIFLRSNVNIFKNFEDFENLRQSYPEASDFERTTYNWRGRNSSVDPSLLSIPTPWVWIPNNP